MPRLSRDDATRVIAALRRLAEVDGAAATELEVGRVVSRLAHRAVPPDAAPRDRRTAPGRPPKRIGPGQRPRVARPDE